VGCVKCDAYVNIAKRRVNTDAVRLRHLKNVIYNNVNPNHISNHEVRHFKLYYLCPVCGFYTTFEKDEAPYATIHFMANYRCYNCLNLCSIEDGFMINVSPDQGIDLNSGDIIDEEEYERRMLVLNSFYEMEKNGTTYGNA